MADMTAPQEGYEFPINEGTAAIPSAESIEYSDNIADTASKVISYAEAEAHNFGINPSIDGNFTDTDKTAANTRVSRQVAGLEAADQGKHY